jgi:hypothetical protein
MKPLLAGAVTACLMATHPCIAQETRSAVAGQASPAARVAELAWLSGEWTGAGIGGAPAREVYSAPLAGHLTGHFVQTRGEGIAFMELVDIAEEGDTLVYRLKHFNADLTGWEERGEVRRFPLVAKTDSTWFFDGLTIRRDGPDRMTGAVRVASSDGPSRELVFHYSRASRQGAQ